MSTNGNDPAYPQVPIKSPYGDYTDFPTTGTGWAGLTKREEIATRLLSAMVAADMVTLRGDDIRKLLGLPDDARLQKNDAERALCRSAIQLADTMIKELSE